MVTRRPANPPTMQHILSHGGANLRWSVAGFGKPVDQAYQDLGIARGGGETLLEFADKLGRVPLLDPGHKWCYSLATDVWCARRNHLGSTVRIIPARADFEPLGMTDTGFRVTDEKLDRFAACYMRSVDKQVLLEDDPHTVTTVISGTSSLAAVVWWAQRLTTWRFAKC